VVQEIPYFHVALNLPHAGRVARRIVALLKVSPGAAFETSVAMALMLDPWLDRDENPPGAEAVALRERAAQLGRTLVDQIEDENLGQDRLGQCVRNYFECLELGREGALISLRAGENPKSIQRPC
jgi:hypothetical protein